MNEDGDQMPSLSQEATVDRSPDSARKSVNLSKLALELGASESKTIDPGAIVVQDWVRLKCQYACILHTSSAL